MSPGLRLPLLTSVTVSSSVRIGAAGEVVRSVAAFGAGGDGSLVTRLMPPLAVIVPWLEMITPPAIGVLSRTWKVIVYRTKSPRRTASWSAAIDT